jgi:hypothetical protein
MNRNIVSFILLSLCVVLLGNAASGRAAIFGPAPSPMPTQTYLPLISAGSPDVPPKQGQKIPGIPVTGKPYATLAFKPFTPYSSVTVAPDGRIVLSCVLQQGSDPGICVIDPTSATQTVLVDPTKDGVRPGTGYLHGNWLVYAQFDAPQRILARNVATGETIEVGRIAAGTIDSPVGPVYAIADTQIVWVDEAATPDGKRTERIVLFDLTTRQSRVLKTLPPQLVVDSIAIWNDTVVWSQVDVRDHANVRSDVHMYQITPGTSRALTQTGRASMPRVWGHYVVWKATASRFAYGSIYLYDLATNTGKEIATAVPGQSGYDMPTIGARGITWLSATNDRIVLYHPENNTTEILDHGGGRAYTAGQYIAWVNNSVTQPTDWYLLWSDLSRPQ